LEARSLIADMTRSCAVAVGAIVVVLSAAPPAGATAIVGPVVADGARWAAWTLSPGVATVYDDRSRQRRRVAVPDCPLGAVHAGTLVLACPNAARYGEPDPILVDVRTGRQTNVGGPDLIGDTFERFSFTGVGRRGLLVDVDGYHYETRFAFDWRSRTRYPLNDPRRTVDLDRHGLTRALCSPLVRSATPDADVPYAGKDPYLPMATWRRWAVENVPPRASARVQLSTIRVWRCGERHPRILARCLCGDVDIGAGMVVWRGDRIRAFDLASGARRSWRLPRTGHARVSQAGRSLLIWTGRTTIDDPPARLRIVRWAPRRLRAFPGRRDVGFPPR
jgi:hypothetical protein